MSAILAAAALQAGSQLLGNALSNSANRKAVAEQNKGNMQLAKYQYDTQLEQWNRENQYNTPAAQKERLTAAGLNPNLVYGSGQAVTTSANSPSYEAPHLQAYTNNRYDVGEAANTVMTSYLQQLEARRMLEQNKLIQTQRTALESDIVTKGLAQANYAIRNAQGSFNLDMARNLQQNSLDVASQNLLNLKAKGSQILESTDLLRQQISQMPVKTDLLRQQVAQTKASTYRIAVESGLSKARIQQVIQATSNLVQTHDIQEFDTNMQKAGIPRNSPWYVRFLKSAADFLTTPGMFWKK